MLPRPLVSTAVALLSLAPAVAQAGPYASPAMGRALKLDLPWSLHAGGSLGAGLGRTQDRPARGLVGSGFLEGHFADAMVFGLGVHAQALPSLPSPVGERATAVTARFGVRIPLVPSRRFGSVAVPVVALRGEAGLGWIGEAAPGVDGRFARYAVSLAFELVLTRHITPFASVGWGRLESDAFASVRQAEVQLGVSFHLAGGRKVTPRDRSPLREGFSPVADPEPSSRTRRLLDRFEELTDDD